MVDSGSILFRNSPLGLANWKLKIKLMQAVPFKVAASYIPSRPSLPSSFLNLFCWKTSPIWLYTKSRGMCYTLEVGLARNIGYPSNYISLSSLPPWKQRVQSVDIVKNFLLFFCQSPSPESFAKTNHFWPMDQDFRIHIASFMAGRWRTGHWGRQARHRDER